MANPEVLHQDRITYVTQKKTLGYWLEEAILDKIKRGSRGSSYEKLSHPVFFSHKGFLRKREVMAQRNEPRTHKPKKAERR